MAIYLDAKEELGEITKEENEGITKIVTAAYMNVTVGELNIIRKMF